MIFREYPIITPTQVTNVPILNDKNEIGSRRVKEDGPLKRLDVGLFLCIH